VGKETRIRSDIDRESGKTWQREPAFVRDRPRFDRTLALCTLPRSSIPRAFPKIFLDDWPNILKFLIIKDNGLVNMAKTSDELSLSKEH
jgi:hypothetical protein